MNRRDRALTMFRWLWPLAALAGSIYAAWRLFLHIEFSQSDDARILLGIGGSYLVAIAFLLIFTRRWDLRSLGQVATYAADAGLYLSLGVPQFEHWHPMTPEEQSLLRASFTVGCSFLLVGLLYWVITTRGGRRERMWATR